MNDNERLPESLRPLEAALASLVPRRDRLSQEQLWFEAGRRAAIASAAPSSGGWRVAGAAAASAIAAMAATLLVTSSMRPHIDRVQRTDRSDAVAARRADTAPTSPTDSIAAPEGDDGSLRGDAVDAERMIGERSSITTTRIVAAKYRGARATQLESYGRLLRNGADLTNTPHGEFGTADSAHAIGRVQCPTYYQQRQALLGEQAHGDSQPQHSRATVRGA